MYALVVDAKHTEGDLYMEEDSEKRRKVQEQGAGVELLPIFIWVTGSAGQLPGPSSGGDVHERYFLHICLMRAII